MKNLEQLNMTRWQTLSLTILRIAIGWHFLYEGMVKVTNPKWSAISFLESASGPFASFFKSIASNAGALELVNFLNQWGLLLMGLSLMAGLLSRWASLGGMALIALYYFASPPFVGMNNLPAMEGNYLIVNKNLIEIFALWVLFQFHESKIYGIDRFFIREKR